MDDDWGSSSDEETVAEREKRDEEKRKETMALLAAFEATRGGACARATQQTQRHARCRGSPASHRPI